MSWRFTAISIGYAVLISSVGLGLYAFYSHEYNACSIGLLGKFLRAIENNRKILR